MTKENQNPDPKSSVDGREEPPGGTPPVPADSGETPAPSPYDPPATAPEAPAPEAPAPEAPAAEGVNDWGTTSEPRKPGEQFGAPDGSVPPPPPAPPAAWPPSEHQEFPSPEEDAALREQRARRFGAPDSTDPHSPETDADAVDGNPTQVFSPEGETRGFTPPPVVTPIPAAPAGPATESPFPQTTQMPATAPPAVPAQKDYSGFEGLHEESTSRAAAHWWTVLITLVFAPVAWYLFTDGGARIEWASSQSQAITVAAYIEFGLGLVAVFIFLLAARWSSLGSIIMGSLFFALGAAFLIFPGEGSNILVQSTEYFGRLGQFGINVVEHLGSTLETGRMALYGLVMIMVGVVSHGARRQGRREERTRIALEE